MAKVTYYRIGNTVPVKAWLKGLDDKALIGARGVVDLLKEHGYKLTRPYEDALRDGIRELRWHVGNEQYRLLYFSCKQDEYVISHGFKKTTDSVPEPEIELTLERKLELERSGLCGKKKHTTKKKGKKRRK